MHERYMREALALAANGRGHARPNPLVGAVLVSAERVIGRGFHAFFGGPHAEIRAIEDARANGFADLSDSTLYVNLEPCCHVGKTPPCADRLIAERIPRVVVGMIDPNPLVAGKGVAALRSAGIEVTVGVLEDECREMNRAFCKFVSTGLPYVLLKAGMSLDGKTATSSGESKWITSEESRLDARRLRAEFAAVLCGVGTVRADDPMLTPRSLNAKNPVRVVVDSNLSIPRDSKIVASARAIPTIVATASGDDARELEAAGISIVRVPGADGRVDLAALMRELGRAGIDSVLVEGGAEIAHSALACGIVDRIRYYVAPLILGGTDARPAVGGAGFPAISSAPRLGPLTAERLGSDLVVEADVCSPA